MALNATSPNLHLNAIGLRAGGAGRCLVQGLDAHIQAGQRWVLLGPNGAGKTTLLNVIAGLLPATAGTVNLDGRSVAQIPADDLARLRAWCPQFWLDPFPVSAWETVACAIAAMQPNIVADDLKAAALQYLRQVDMIDFADADVRSLSGGERQRVAIATACAQAAPILLLDEPTAHLDWAHQMILQDVLADHAAQGGTVIAAVHDLNFAWHMASHALLLDGRGGAVAGARDTVMTSENLSVAFAVPVSRGEDESGPWFRVQFSQAGR